MAEDMNRRKFLKKTLIGSAGAVAVGLSLNQKALAREDDFSTRVVREHINAISLYRDKLLLEPHRPTYHFVVPEGIAEPFDPNGAIYFKGRYHLFYIFQNVRPREGYRGDSWGHVSSHDLVHWRFHPTALKPSGLEVAIYSGNAFINKEGVPTIVYQGLGAGNCIATSTDPDLNVWVKSPHNPVVPYPEVAVDEGEFEFREILDRLPEYGKYDVWDPHAWLDGDTYYLISGDNSGWPHREPTLWKSKDLIEWEFLGDFLHHDMPDVDEDWQVDCPDFFKIGNKYMLLCLGPDCRYYIGQFKNEKFYPEHHAHMRGCSAPESMLDDKGRRIMWAWVPDPYYGRRDQFIVNRGWSGMWTLPRVLTLVDGILHMEPAEEFKTLRGKHTQLKNLSVKARTELKIDEVASDTLELDLTIDPRDAVQCGIKVRCSPGGEEETAIVYDPKNKTIRIDLAKSTLDEFYSAWAKRRGFKQEAPLELKPGELLNLHIFLDRSIMEVFINGRQCITQRLYPTRDDSKAIVLFSKAGTIKVPVLNAWKMNPSNPW